MPSPSQSDRISCKSGEHSAYRKVYTDVFGSESEKMRCRLLEAQKVENGGHWPETIAVVLWGTDNIKTYGESLAQVPPSDLTRPSMISSPMHLIGWPQRKTLENPNLQARPVASITPHLAESMSRVHGSYCQYFIL